MHLTEADEEPSQETRSRSEGRNDTTMDNSGTFEDAMSSGSGSSAQLMLSEEFEAFIDKLPANWRDKFEKPTTTEQAYGTIAGRAVHYRHMTDGMLASAYHEDFGDWTMDDWKMVNKDMLRSFNNFLRKRGLLIKITNQPIFKRMMEATKEDDYVPWAQADVIRQRTHGGFVSGPIYSEQRTKERQLLEEESRDSQAQPNPERLASHGQQLHQPEMTTISNEPRLAQDGNYQGVPYMLNAPMMNPRLPQDNTPTPRPARPAAQIPHIQTTARHPQPTAPAPEPMAYPEVPPISSQQEYVPFRQPHRPAYGPSHLANGPPDMTRGTTLTNADIRRAMVDLIKSYNNDRDKYSGDKYDFMTQKIVYFKTYAQTVGLAGYDYAQAFPMMLTGMAREFYFYALAGRDLSFEDMADLTQRHFETPESCQEYLREWTTTTLQSTIQQNPTKSKIECFEEMTQKLRRCQCGLAANMQDEDTLRRQILLACSDIRECEMAIMKPASTLEGVCADIRNAINTRAAMTHAQYVVGHDAYEEEEEQFWTDRTYGRARPNHRNFSGQGANRYRPQTGSYRPQTGSGRRDLPHRKRDKECYVCGKKGCWSTKHTTEERQRAYERYKTRAYITQDDPTYEAFEAFLCDFEGLGVNDGEDMDKEQAAGTTQYYTEFSGEIDPYEAVTTLNDQVIYHAITKHDPFGEKQDDRDNWPNVEEVFMLQHYDEQTFQGILPDTGASGMSTAGQGQAKALIRRMPNTEHSTEGGSTIRFGKGSTTTVGTITVDTPIGRITFHVVPTMTPFLLSLNDMNRMNVYLNNVKGELVQGNKTIRTITKWGHQWMMLELQQTAAWCNLTEPELRTLHRRFGHPSAKRLHDLLERNEMDFDNETFEKISKHCHQCQIQSRGPGRFRFRLQEEDIQFNAEIIVDIMYLDSKPVLHVVDTATSFQAARFLRNMSSKATWEALRACWIDVYIGPPEKIVHDAGTNFHGIEFQQLANSMDITVKEVPIEAHHSIGKVERYHAPLARAYAIIKEETQDTSLEYVLQSAIKAVNDSIGPKGLVPTLLVFGTYPRMTPAIGTTPSIQQRAAAIHKAMRELNRIRETRQIRDAVNTRNGPDVTRVRQLSPNDDVLVWREHDKWTGPYKVLTIEGDTVTVSLQNGPVNFRSTSIKRYNHDRGTDTTILFPPAEAGHDEEGKETKTKHKGEEDTSRETAEAVPDMTQGEEENHIPQRKTAPARRGRGRPKRSKNRVKVNATFLSSKELADQELSLKLRALGRITTPGSPFEISDQREIEALLSNQTFRFEAYDKDIHQGRIFRSRLVREIKAKNTESPYEKSRLVIQGFGDKGKEAILTQSPTIQRASQRLILALTPTLCKDFGLKLALRDITQAYTQSTTKLNRTILATPPKEIANKYPKDTVMVVVKPLYGVAESGTHWWVTYSKYHKEKLRMDTSTYDPCLLLTTEESKGFGVVGMQTDDTLILADDQFHKDEETQLPFKAKEKEYLKADDELTFNGCVIQINDQNEIYIKQKGQGKRIGMVDSQTKYVEQRARGAYLVTICQPEATFDLSIAAQIKDPEDNDIEQLNKRLKWQMDNPERGVRYVEINLKTANMYIFVDGSFANNKDLSSQIGFIILIGNESPRDTDNKTTAKIRGNIIHWSSTKSKRVTRSVLASEIYAMAHGVDIAYSINTTISAIINRLKLKPLPLIVCTDSFSLYECIVKLGTTKEKHLMIDIMALRQMYERRELIEVRWINGVSNPADAMTKGTPSAALSRLIDTNEVEIAIEGWVER